MRSRGKSVSSPEIAFFQMSVFIDQLRTDSGLPKWIG